MEHTIFKKTATRFLICVALVGGTCGLVFAGAQQTSDSLISVVVSNARSHLNDATSPYVWSTASLLAWVNNGIVDIVTKTHCLEDTFTVIPAIGIIEYPTPQSKKYISIESAWYYNGTAYKGLKKVAPSDSGKTVDIGEPVCWYEWNMKLFVYPYLATDNGFEMITFTFISKPDAVALTDYSPMPSIYDKSLTLYVVSQALFQKGKMQSGAAIMKEYQEELDRYRVDLDEKLP